MRSIEKGQEIEIAEKAGIKMVLNWENQEIDCDLMAFMLDENGVIPTRWDIIFYNVHRHESRCMEQLGIKRYEGKKFDEIAVDLNKIPEKFKKILFFASVYDAAQQGWDLASAGNMELHCKSCETEESILSYKIDEKDSDRPTVILGELYRKNKSWRFKVIDQKDHEQLIGVLATRYGMRVDWRSDYQNISKVN